MALCHANKALAALGAANAYLALALWHPRCGLALGAAVILGLDPVLLGKILLILRIAGGAVLGHHSEHGIADAPKSRDEQYNGDYLRRISREEGEDIPQYQKRPCQNCKQLAKVVHAVPAVHETSYAVPDSAE